jgi:hypothetical protein
MCYNTCGPEKSGVKSETCSGGIYAEQSGCSFDPAKTYSCFKLPANTTVIPAYCDGTIPQAGQPCTIADCMPCYGTDPSVGTPAYKDSTMTSKPGYCVCQASATTPTWSCASTTAWPCPTGNGC